MVFLELKPNNPAIHKSVILWDDCELETAFKHTFYQAKSIVLNK